MGAKANEKGRNRRKIHKYILHIKDTLREKNNFKQNSIAYEKYKYGHLGSWYIKSTIY